MGFLIGTLIGGGSAFALVMLTDIIGLICASLAISLLSATCLALTYSNKTLSEWANRPLYFDDASFTLKWIQQGVASALIGSLSAATLLALIDLYISLLLPLSNAISFGPSFLGQFFSGALSGIIILTAAATIIGSAFYIKTKAPAITAQCKHCLGIVDSTAAFKNADKLAAIHASPPRNPLTKAAANTASTDQKFGKTAKDSTQPEGPLSTGLTTTG